MIFGGLIGMLIIVFYMVYIYIWFFIMIPRERGSINPEYALNNPRFFPIGHLKNEITTSLKSSSPKKKKHRSSKLFKAYRHIINLNKKIGAVQPTAETIYIKSNKRNWELNSKTHML